MKRLVLCCDGTWNRADQETAGKPCPTNVVKIAYRLRKRDDSGVEQIVFYDHGVGTGNWFDKITGGATGAGLEGNIHDGYMFLVANYEPGDEIYLLGFSRGAFTARSLAGMVRKCGVVSRVSIEQFHPAEDLYHRSDVHPDAPEAVEFRRKYAVMKDQPTPIHMIGVWDTVGALGIPLRGLRATNRKEYQFHDTQLSRSVQFAFHALAIDERRAPFEPTLWIVNPAAAASPDMQATPPLPPPPATLPQQIVRQVWFPGVHSDIGGGYAETNLSDLALAWMIESATEAGLVFDQDVMAAHPLQENAAGRLHDSMTLLYRLQPPLSRRIAATGAAATDATQTLHASVRERWDKDPAYRPKNLRDYFARTGDARAKQH